MQNKALLVCRTYSLTILQRYIWHALVLFLFSRRLVVMKVFVSLRMINRGLLASQIPLVYLQTYISICVCAVDKFIRAARYMPCPEIILLKEIFIGSKPAYKNLERSWRRTFSYFALATWLLSALVILSAGVCEQDERNAACYVT